MRKRNAYTAHFSFSYDELSKKSIEKEAFLRRDLADLNARGITEANIDAMVALRVEFNAQPADGADNASVSLACTSRNETSTTLTIAVRGVISIALATFGEKSAELEGFKIKGLSKLSASELYAQTPKIVVNGNKYFDAMENFGLTAAMLTNITNLTSNLTVLVADTTIVEGDKTIVTGDRRTAADNLFDCMSGLCKTAANYYKPTNKTKAREYVMYTMSGKPIIRKGNVKAGKTNAPKTKGIKATTKFKLKTRTGTSLQYFFGIIKGSAPTESAVTVTCNKKRFTTTTAAKLGYNKAAGIIVLNILNLNADDAGYVVRMGG